MAGPIELTALQPGAGSLLRRALGDGHSQASMSLFPAPTTASASQTSAFGFPTRSPDTGQSSAKTSPNLYLIFLAVLLFLFTLSATLAIRAVRIRRRYRTAVQAAIASGGPLPVWDSRPFGSALSQDLRGLETTDAFREIARSQKHVGPPPNMWEVVDRDTHTSPLLDTFKNHSWTMLKPVSVMNLDLAASSNWQQTDRVPTADTSASGSRPRPFSNVGLFAGRNPPSVPAGGEPGPRRTIGGDDGIQVAIIIQMPIQKTDETDTNEEGSGWRPGMELGVWRGVALPM